MVLNETKVCPWCGDRKPISEFHRNRAQRDGLNGYCKPCWNVYCKQRWAAEMDKPARLRTRRLGHLRTKYSISLVEYEERLAAQGGRCPTCLRTVDEAPQPARTSGLGLVFVVDHDHRCCPTERTCGKCIRGLLCSPCNMTLGFMQDDTARLERAIEYLKERDGTR